MDVRGELIATYKDQSRRKLDFRGYVHSDEDGMSNVEIQTVYNQDGTYMKMDDITGYEILNYTSE